MTFHSAARLPPLLIAILVPVLAILAACGDGNPNERIAKADASYALQVLDRAPAQGFAKGAFGVAAIHAAIERHDPRSSGMLRTAVIAYARAEHGLLIPAKSRPQAWGDAAAPYDAATELDAALRQHRFQPWIDALPPPDELYQTLQKAYAATLTQLPSAQAAAQASPQDAAFATTLRANLERLRWLPRDAPGTRIDVNIAAMSLTYLVDGQPRLTMKTASGKPGDETPILTSRIDHIVLNPPWNVPKDIAEKELLPKGSDYLAAHGFETKDDGGLVQQPGPESALGDVKFDFPNRYSVYLHDTPSKAAFDRAGRAVSHGCVRLEHALDLADLLLADQPGWPPEHVQEVIAERQTVTIALSRPVPVRLLYLTAIPRGGEIVLVPDVYGWDRAVLQTADAAALSSAS